MKYILFKDNFGVYNYQTPYRIIYTDSINVKDIYINIIQKYNINNNNEITQSCDRETTLENLKTDLSYSIVPVTRDHSKDYAIARANIFNVIQKLHEVGSDSYSIGGYIDNPDVLPQDGDCVILASAICKEGTYIKDNAIIGEAMIRGNVTISDNSIIFITNIFSGDGNNININGNAVIISSQLRLSSPQCNTLNIGDNVYIRGCNITGGADDHPTSIFISGYSYLHGIDIFNRFEPTAHTIKLHNTILENHCKGFLFIFINL